MAQMERLTDAQITSCRGVLTSRKGRYAKRDAALFEFGLHTGHRISESLKLTWAHILDADEQFKDFVCIEAKHLKGAHRSPKPTQQDQLRLALEALLSTITVAETRTAFEALLAVMGATKAKRKTVKSRTLPMHPECVAALAAWKHEQQRQLGAEWSLHTPVFSSRVRHKDGSRRAISRETAWRTLKALYKEAGMKGFYGTHSLRRTYCQVIDEFCQNIDITQAAMGHSSQQSTQQYRAKVDQSTVLDVIVKAFDARGKAA